MMKKENPKEHLLTAIDGAITFRHQKAEQYPKDPKSLQAANDLKKLLAYVQKLPDTHPVFEKFNSLDSEEIMEVSSAISQYYSTDRDDDEEQFINSVILKAGDDN